MVFRQYACYGQFAELYRRHHNVHVIPLGYVAGTLAGRSSVAVGEAIESIHAPRYFAWSMIGDPARGNRWAGLKAFGDVRPNCWGDHRNKTAMAAIYASSSFVLSGRGHMNLDCFRHYEASIFGAIPIVVGSASELNNTFGHFGSYPPWVFASSWRKAKTRVQELLSRPELLEHKRHATIQWWRAEVERVRSIMKQYTAK